MSETDDQNPYSKLLEWSADRPAWQRDALRRIVQTGTIDAKNQEELLEILKRQRGIEVPGTAIAPAPLDSTHLPAITAPAANSVSLLRIENPKNVNAISDTQVLPFIADGISVIYGSNGTGKSGFARIIKRACRARSNGNLIKGNVFVPGKKPQASANIAFSLNGTERSAAWKDGELSDINLSVISFFDSECATIHVDKENDVAFTPRYLGILNELATVTLALNEALSAEKLALQKRIGKKIDVPVPHAATAAGKFIGSLSSTSKTSELDTLVTGHEGWAKSLSDLDVLLAKDPEKEIAKQKIIQGTLQSLSRDLTEGGMTLSDSSIQELIQLIDKAHAASEAAKVSAGQLFKDEPIPNIGSAAWKMLWESASGFSKSTFGDHGFPIHSNDPRCVLCQQDLSAAAQTRMKRFEDFIANDAAKKSKDADLARDAKKSSVSKVRFSGKTRDLVGVLASIDSALATEVRSYILVIRKRTIRAAKFKSGAKVAALPELKAEVISKLSGVVENIKAGITKLELSKEPAQKLKNENEAKDIRAKQWLKGIYDEAKEKIELYQSVETVLGAIQDCNTNSITRFSGEMSAKYVTNTLRDRFAEEMNKLGINSVKAELAKSSAGYGKQNYRIQLIAAPEQKVGEVLSEGEFRCLSIAGFLAELATADHGSAIVFDDPVSSLDHRYRKRVAKRLIEVAKERQVIVFTHDLFFLFELAHVADTSGVKSKFCHIERAPKPGTVCDDLPWIALPVKKRVGFLRNEFQKAKGKFNSGDESGYQTEAGVIYGRLRQTWERAIEEVLLNGTILRFGEEVQTQRLRAVIDFSEEDYKKIDAGMSKCSTYMIGHDGAAAINDDMPQPDELEQDINSLDQWRDQIIQRRK